MTKDEAIESAMASVHAAGAPPEGACYLCVPEKVLRWTVSGVLSSYVESIIGEVKQWHDALSPGAEAERVQLQHVIRMLKERK